MKKRILSITAVLVLLFGPMMQDVRAQVFLDQESLERYSTEYGDLPNVPVLNVTLDQYEEMYAPLGGEMVVLGCLCGAYLMGKRKKQEKK